MHIRAPDFAAVKASEGFEPSQVRKAMQYLTEHSQLAGQRLELCRAQVTGVQQLGMGDR